MTHIKHILAALLFGALVSADVDAGMGYLIGDNAMLVNRQYELPDSKTYRNLYRVVFEVNDMPEVVKVTGIRQFDSRSVHVNAIVHEDDATMPQAATPVPVSEMLVEVVRPGTVLQQLNASDYHSSLTDGSQVFVRLNYK